MSRIDKLIQELCPNGVEYKKLREVVYILNGYAFKSVKYTNNGIRVIRISDVQKGIISDKDVKYYPIESQQDEIRAYLLKENDLVMSLTGNAGRVAMLSKAHLPAGLNQRVACIRPKTKALMTRYLYHFFCQDSFESEAMNNATGGGQKNMSTTWLSNFIIPIPPLSIQQEIVNILDKFTTLEAELEAELEARKKQYEYYRDKLLTPIEVNGKWYMNGKVVECVSLGSIGKFIRGNGIQKKDFTDSGVGCIHYGQIHTYYGTYTYNTKTFVSEAHAKKLKKAQKGDLIIATTSEDIDGVCKAVAWLGNEDIAIGGDTYIFKHNQNAKYMSYIFRTKMFSDHKKKYVSGTKVIRVSGANIAKFQIPIPPLEEQERIVAILDKFDALVSDISVGLPAEIDARRKQYEYYRNKLLTFKNIADAQGA